MSGKGRWRIALVCVPAVVGVIAASGLVGRGRASAAAEKPKDPKFAYVGVSSCKMCHKSKKRGEQHAIWQKSKHAHAYETLKSAQAGNVAEELGLKKPAHESPECLRCHVTGWDLTAGQKAKFLKRKFKIEDGVQCETCHGPGEKYKKLSVMKDREKAVKNGLVVGDEKLCLTCHNDESPSWNPERYTTKDGKKVGFDFETAWGRIKHPVPKKK